MFSLRTIIDACRATLLRFPLEVAFMLVGCTVAMIIAVCNSGADHFDVLLRMLFSAIFAMDVSLAASVASECHGWRARTRWMLSGVGIVATTLVVFTISDSSSAMPLQIASLAVGLHALIALAPFGLGPRAVSTFNIRLFVRVLIGGLFSGIIFAGLMGSLGLVDALFNVDTPAWLYALAATISLGLVNTLIILAGIPHVESDSTDSLDSLDTPNTMRWLIQFVLIPIVLIMTTIVTTYGGFVLFGQQLRGTVVSASLSVFILVILTWLLGWPLNNNPEHRAVTFFLRWARILIAPLAILAAIGIVVRILEVGFTAERHVALLCTIYACVVTVYLFVRRQPDIRVFPLLLIVVTMSTIIGPLSATSLTMRSQESIIMKTIAQSGLSLPMSSSKELSTILSEKDSERILSAMKTLEDVDPIGYQRIETSFGPNGDAKLKELRAITEQRRRRREFVIAEWHIENSATESAKINESTYYLAFNNIDYPFTAPNGDVISSGSTLRILVTTSPDGRRDSIDLHSLDREREDHVGVANRNIYSHNGTFTLVPLDGYMMMTGDTITSISMKCLLIKNAAAK